MCTFYNRLYCSQFIFAFLKPLLQPCCHGDDLITVLCPGFRRVAHRDAVVAFARGAHALPVACAWLIELHGWTVLQGDKRAGTWERHTQFECICTFFSWVTQASSVSQHALGLQVQKTPWSPAVFTTPNTLIWCPEKLWDTPRTLIKTHITFLVWLRSEQRDNIVSYNRDFSPS